MKLVIGCFLSAVFGSLFTFWLVDEAIHDRVVAQDRGGTRGPGFLAGPSTPGRASATSQTVPLPDVYNDEGLSDDEAIAVAVYENMNRSVVNITTKGSRSDGFFSLEVPSEGTGSGTIVDKAGHILTNFHVVENANQVAVTLFNGKTYDASFVGADPVNDVAVIKIDAPKEVVFPVEFGDSGKLRVGMRVFAIGNPFGLERTLTTGIISSLNRSLQIRGNYTIKSIIQIDAAINPGNSGGPLLDAHGRLIGMNTAIASKTGQSSGVGFAIPVNLMSRVVPELIEHGRVIRPEVGLERVFETGQGLLIARISPNGAAERAGLRGPRVERRRRGPFVLERLDRTAADLIVAVGGKEVLTVDDFHAAIERYKPGDRVAITVIREGEKLNVTVDLGGELRNRRPGNGAQ